MDKRPHAPLHWFKREGHYMLTAGTYRKAKLFSTAADLDLLQNITFELAEKESVNLHSWNFFPNHYHLIVEAPPTLPAFIRKLHSCSAREINARQQASGRQVWYQYWDTFLDNEKAYYSRMNYVNQNAVHHGIVQQATKYRWCSAAWLEANARRSFLETLRQFDATRISIRDDF
jgi:REP-associated tyrosine transposase